MQALEATKFINSQLQSIITKYLKIAEFDVAINVALWNWITRVVNNMLKFGVNNELDAWRKLYHRYVPLADDLQNAWI